MRDEQFIHNRLSKFQYFEGDLDATRNSEEVLLVTGARARFFHSGGWVGFKPGDYGTPVSFQGMYAHETVRERFTTTTTTTTTTTKEAPAKKII